MTLTPRVIVDTVRAVVVLALAGCFQPNPAVGAACSPSGLCPTPLQCVANLCVEPGVHDASPDTPVPDAAAGPILLLHMDDNPSGGQALDSAGGHLVTCTHCPTLIAAARVGTGAYHFGGSDELDISSGDFNRTGASTLAMWVQITATPANYDATCAKNLPPNDASYGMAVGSDLRAQYYTSGSQPDGATPLTENAWHHLAMTWDGSAIVRGYLDGALDHEYTSTGFALNPMQPFAIGDVNGSNFLTGNLDEFAYYDRALSEPEITALANP